MSTKLENIAQGVVKVTVTADSAKWKEAQEKALKKVASKVQIKGFRKGKVPFELAKDHVSQGEVLDEAIKLSLNDLYGVALNENKIHPYGNPDVNVTKISDADLEVEFTITLYPSCELGKYTGLNIKEEISEVSEDEVKASIDSLLKNNAELVLKEGAAEKGDTVVMDFKGYIDGKEFDGGSAENYELVLGSNQFIPGFEDQLVGATSETNVDVNVTFPEQYVKDLAGKNAKFVCKIHEIKSPVTPELNDEFVKGLGYEGVETVEALNTYQTNLLKTQKANEAHNKLFVDILNTIISSSTYTIPEAAIKDEAAQMKKDLENQIAQNGLTLEQYKEIVGVDDAKLQAQFEEQATVRLKEFLTIYSIGEKEKITVTKDEIEDYYKQLAENYHMEVEKVKEYFKASSDRITSNLVQNKIERFMIDSNVYVETKEEKVEESK
ncbi:MAG: trigger factor [Candidatus Onthovivens sp.]|nr:trigger factor [Candidatus Onthovivens sp.]